jgi:ribonuclease-3 family protein
VNAKAQAEAYDRILPELTEEEKDVLRRGRNAHPATVAKHASVGDYRKATGLEALIGFLYMDGQTERMMELIKSCIKLKTD